MGCDIHMFIEFKAHDEWWEYGKFTLDRNYGMFGVLAEVRGVSENGFEPKGLPKELSDGIGESYEEWGKNDVHSETWLTTDEFDLAIKDFEKEFECRAPVDYRIINLILKELKEDKIEARAVFWFDN